VSVSSTISTASTVDMSETVRSWVPGLFMVPMTVTSPAFTRSVVTIPSMGARTVVLERVSRLALRPARIWSTRFWAAPKAERAVSRPDWARW